MATRKSNSKYKPISKSKPSRAKPKTKIGTQKKNIRVVPLRASVVEQLPETALTRKGMTLRKLLANTPKFRREIGQEEVTLTRIKKATTASGLPAIKAIARHKDPFMPNKTIKDREVFIIGLDSQTKPVNKQRRVMVSCNCVTGDTRVLTSEGWRTIYEIAGEHTQGHYPIDYNISGKMIAGSVPYYKGIQKVYTIALANGNKVTATADHKFLVSTPRDAKNKWIKLKNLTTQHTLLLNSFTPDIGSIDTQSPEYLECLFLGMLMGDGSFTDKDQTSAELRLFGKKKELAEKIISLGIIRDETDCSKDGTRLSFYKHKIMELIHRYKYTHKQGINIKNINQFMGYLSGLISTDGGLARNGDASIVGEEYYLKALQEYAFQFGFSNTRVKTYASESKGKETNYGKRNHSLYHFTISADSIYAYLDYLTVRQDQQDKVNRNSPLKCLKYRARIDNISYAGRQAVYDITVPGPTRFVVSGNIIAHNCEDFCFHGGEYACALHGAAKIIYGNGEPPNFTNPHNVPFLCKHLSALAYKVISSNL